MANNELFIEPLRKEEEYPIELLKLADPSDSLIKSYLKTGNCHIARKDSRIIGVIIFSEIETDCVEINNIAVEVGKQGNGVGTQLLKYAEDLARKNGFERIIVATGNSSVNQLAFYQKIGYEMVEIEKDYFTKNYIEPIFENGIQCKHKIVLEKRL